MGNTVSKNGLSNKTWLSLAATLLLQLSIAAVLTMILLYLSAKVFCFTDISQAAYLPFAVAVGALALFTVNLLFYRNTMLFCLGICSLYWLILCVIGLTKGSVLTVYCVLKWVAFVAAGAIGTILAQLKRTNKQRRIKR